MGNVESPPTSPPNVATPPPYAARPNGPKRPHDATMGISTPSSKVQFMGETMTFAAALNEMQVGKKWRMKKADRDLNDRIGNTHKVLDPYMPGGDQNFVCRINGKPAGLMSLSVRPDDGLVQIEGLVTLPGTKGVGSALIEHAVQLSMESGFDGKVGLRYLDDTSHDAYERLGFVDNGGYDDNGRWNNSMYLLPSAKQKQWANVDGEWRLKHLAEQPPRAAATGR